MKLHGKYMTALALLASAGLANATEGGGTSYPGPENYLAGAAPPPGLYLLGYGTSYSSSKIRDNGGNDVTPPGFKVDVNVVSLRGVWSSPHEMLGGSLVFHSILPLVDLNVSVPGASQHKSGVGDLTVGVGLAKHHSANLHTVAALDFVLPIGGYNKTDIANIGRNYASFQPAYIVTYIDPQGFNGDIKLTYNMNQKNTATQYRSGDEIFVDYAAGYGLGNGWTMGVGGLYRQQLTDDTANGATVANNKASSFAIGPSVKYDNGKGWFIIAKWQAESSVRNTTQGSAFWVKTIIPF